MKWSLVAVALSALVIAGGIEAQPRPPSPIPRERAQLEAALAQIAAGHPLRGVRRPATDGTLDLSGLREPMRVLSARIPDWDEAMALGAASENHVHPVGEHELRAFLFFRGTRYARSLAPDRLYTASLTVLLHDMGKLGSPRDAHGRQRSDWNHPVRSAWYFQRNGDRLGLSHAERDWAARMVRAHEGIGLLDMCDQQRFAADHPLRREQERSLRDAVREASDVWFLEAMAESDVWAIDAWLYDRWRTATQLPGLAARLAARWPAAP